MQTFRSFLSWLTVTVLVTATWASVPAAADAQRIILRLSPDAATAGGAAFTLTIHGTNFTPASTAKWSETTLTTSCVSATTLTAEVPAGLIASAGSALVTVTTASGKSEQAAFTVHPSAGVAPGAPVPESPIIQQSAAVANWSPAVATNANVTLPVGASLSGNLPAPVLSAALAARPVSAPAAAQAAASSVDSSALPATPVQSSASAGSSAALRATFPQPVGGSTSAPAATQAAIATSNQTSSTMKVNFVGAIWYGSAATINLPPTVTSLSPNSVVAGASAFTLIVNGTNFLPGNQGTAVRWNSSISLTTTYVSSTQVTAAVPANLVSATGTALVGVVTAGGTSANVSFTISPPVPVISVISPSRLTAGFGAFILTVYGSGYAGTATLNWGATQLPTTHAAGDAYTANIPASLMTTASTVKLTITTAGGTSNPVSFTIALPPPDITSLSQYSVAAGSPQFTLTINGTGFTTSSFSSLGAPRLKTTFVSTTQMTAVVPASLIASAGQAGVSVYTPGSNWSRAVYFTVTPAPPAIASLSPTSVTAGIPGFTLTINGTAFTLGTIATWGSTPLATNYISPTQLIASVPGTLLQNSGTASVTVSNAQGASAPASLTVNPAPPSISSFSPSMATAGMSAYTIIINGQYFTAGASAKLGSTALTTTFVSATELTATVPAELVASPGATTVSVSSAAGTSGAYAITINPALQINTATVPAATAGSAYSAPINVTGGSPGYNWTVVGLPDSLTYNNTYDNRLTITGTPATAGPITFQVSVTDMAGAVAGPVSYTVNVAAGPSSVNNASLQGSYVCLMQGMYDGDGSRWAAVASFQADGQGNFSSGVFDTNSHEIGSGSGTLTGAYSVGADNNGMASVHTMLTENIAGIQTTQWVIALGGAAQPAQQFRMVEADDLGTLPSGQQNTANCYLATPSAFAASTMNGASFAFGLEGEDNQGILRETVGRFSAAGNTANGTIDTAQGGSATVQSSAFTAAYTAPDPATGRFTMTLKGAGASTGYTVYIIDANRMFVLDNTNNDGEQAGNIRTQQQTSYSGASLSGPFVLYDRGAEFNNSGSTPSGFYANVLQGAGDGAGNLTINQSYTDDDGSYSAGNSNGGPTALVFDAANPGRATFATAGGTTYFYLFDANSGFAMSVNGNGSVDSGWLEAQAQASFTDPALAGNYLFGEAPLLTPAANGSVGEFSLTASGVISAGLSTAGEEYFSWNQAVSTTYSWDQTAPGTGTFQIANGTEGEASCAVISATRFVCTPQTDPSPSVEILQQ